MSYYQKRSILAKSNNPETVKRWHNVLRQLKEKNEDMASVEEILAEAEKNNGVLEFEFEYYTDEAFKEYEDLIKVAESSDNQDQWFPHVRHDRCLPLLQSPLSRRHMSSIGVLRACSELWLVPG